MRMAKVIEFPMREVYDWNIIEKTIKTKLEEHSAPLKMQDEICSRMKEVFVKYNITFETSFQLPIPACATQEETKALNVTVSKAFTELGKKINDLMSIVLFDRLLIEIELYKLRNGI
jgi:hypothetical protein